MDLVTLLAGLPIAAGAVAVYKKWVKPLLDKANKYEIVKDLMESLKDGELTEEEANKLIEDIKKLVTKKA